MAPGENEFDTPGLEVWYDLISVIVLYYCFFLKKRYN